MTTAIRPAEPRNQIAIGVTAALALATVWQLSATFGSTTVLEGTVHAVATAALGTVAYTATTALRNLKSPAFSAFVLEITLHTASIAEKCFSAVKERIIKSEPTV